MLQSVPGASLALFPFSPHSGLCPGRIGTEPGLCVWAFPALPHRRPSPSLMVSPEHLPLCCLNPHSLEKADSAGVCLRKWKNNPKEQQQASATRLLVAGKPRAVAVPLHPLTAVPVNRGSSPASLWGCSAPAHAHFSLPSWPAHHRPTCARAEEAWPGGRPQEVHLEEALSGTRLPPQLYTLASARAPESLWDTLEL